MIKGEIRRLMVEYYRLGGDDDDIAQMVTNWLHDNRRLNNFVVEAVGEITDRVYDMREGIV